MNTYRPDRLFPIAALALAAGCAVYAVARPTSLFALAEASMFPAWTAALPSLLHTFAFALLLAGVVARRAAAVRLVVGWGVIELAAEFAQRAGPVAVPGTFDWLDVAAVVLGTALALHLVVAAEQHR